MDIDNDDSYMSDNSSMWNDSSSEDNSESDNEEINNVRIWCRTQSNIPRPAPPAFQFEGKPGLKAVGNLEDPLDFFNLFFDEELMNYIASETNRFADQFLEKTELTPSARAQNWKETDAKEMRIFLAILLYEGIIQKPVEEWYWSKRHSICTPFINEVMPYKRFQILMKFLHFSNNETFDSLTHPHPRIKKIYEVFQIICRKFQAIYLPEKNIAVDESLIPYKGRLGYKQYIPTKRARFGIKLFELCESQSGYIWNMLIYTGKDTPFQNDYENFGMATRCVMTLSQALLGKGYCLTLDNFYTSPELAELLINCKTDVIGTMRPTRKSLPPSIKNEKLQKGNVIAFQKGKMCVFKWQDKKPICILSTIHNDEMVETRSKQKTVLKPKAVVDYNMNMGGVDKSDQCMAYYPTIRNQQRKYYKKIFRHLLDQVVWNSFVLYQKKGGPLKHLDFRMQLIENLVKNNYEIKLIHKNLGKNPGSVLRLSGRHFPSTVPPTERNPKPRRRCVVCANSFGEDGKRKRIESRYICKICNVGLCASPCFERYHTLENY